MSDIKVETPSDRELRVTRTFNAPAQLVWDAHTKAELTRKWMRGYDGWSMPVCDIDARVGLARAASRRVAVTGAEIDPFEGRELAFHEKLRAGYLGLAAREPGRCSVVDASRPVEEIAAGIWDVVRSRLLPGAR